jgi:hypothetical protein
LANRLSKKEVPGLPTQRDFMTQLTRKFLIAGLSLALAPVSVLSSQQSSARPSDAEARTRTIVAAFSKNKHVVKEKRGVRHEKYKRVESVPVVRSNPATLSGTYEVDEIGSTLTLRIGQDGRVTGSGTEVIGDGIARTFTLSNGRVVGALLTATKVFARGHSERLEGAFLNRTSYDSPTDTGFSQLGLGVLVSPVEMHGVTWERLFYRQR